MIERGDDLRFEGESLAESLCRYLMATSRGGRVSFARYTSPLPPTLIWAIIS
jgi:hypothetical protein